jgi:cell division septation protein DedD
MIRIGSLCILALALVLAASGCSKKKEEAQALQKEAAQDEAARAMDSLAQKAPATDTTAAVSPKPAVAQKPLEQKPVEEKAAEPEYPQEAGYVVQVASYLDHNLAMHMADRYKDRGYDAFLVPAEVDGQQFYRLRIGVFDSYAEAKQVGEQLADRYSAAYWVDNNR